VNGFMMPKHDRFSIAVFESQFLDRFKKTPGPKKMINPIPQTPNHRCHEALNLKPKP
jgi:hypothetical protein